MPSTRDIRRRIKSVTGTAKITKAMRMVASAKMQKAQQAAVNGRPFATLSADLEAHLTLDTGDYVHPLTQTREVRKRAVIVVSTDKGLCGPLNGNLLREVAQYDVNSTVFICAGKKAAQFLGRTRRNLVAEFAYHDNPTYGECHAISRFAQDLFLKGEVDAVDVLFSRFVNTLSQRPEVQVFLPMRGQETRREHLSQDGQAAAQGGHPVQYLFEPGAPAVLDVVLRYLLDFEIMQILLEAKASEHSARMVAMKNATDNANQLVKDLTLAYNKLRQANITNELLEISTAQMASG